MKVLVTKHRLWNKRNYVKELPFSLKMDGWELIEINKIRKDEGA